jgi:hypothetical protein
MDVFALQRNLSGHVLYGKVHGEQLLQNMRQAPYNEALRIVSDWHATP